MACTVSPSKRTGKPGKLFAPLLFPCRPYLPNLFSRPPCRLFTFSERVAASLVAACCRVPPSVSVRSGLFRVANSSWPESLHTVHIITPPMQTRPSIPVIYCRVGGGSRRGGSGEIGVRGGWWGEAVIEVTEEGYFQRTGESTMVAPLSHSRSLRAALTLTCHVSISATAQYFTHITSKNSPNFSILSWPWPRLVKDR